MFELALPVVVGYLGIMLMGLVDLITVGHVSATATGAVGIGTSLFSWCMVFGIGLLFGLDYLISTAFGAGKPEDCHRAFVQGVYLAVGVSLPLMSLLIYVSYHLDQLGVHPEVTREAGPYLRILSVSLIPVLLFSACRQYLQGMSIVRPAVVVLAAANVINGLGNYTLVFGHGGLPALGAEGSAWATLLSRLFMMTSMFGYLAWWDSRQLKLLRKLPFRLSLGPMRELIRLGLPSALQMTFEVGVFTVATTLAARLSPESLAAHQIVLNTASFSFMVPLGVGAATSVLVGQSLGRGDFRGVSKNGWRGFALGCGFMAFSCLIFLIFPSAIVGFYTHDLKVVEVGTGVMMIAAAFQLSDGCQTVATGALRGVGDTRTPAIANLVGHWLVGLPTGIFLCFRLGWGIRGLWVGLSIGLTTVALTLLWKWRRESKLHLAMVTAPTPAPTPGAAVASPVG